jgi:hypothetical protein
MRSKGFTLGSGNDCALTIGSDRGANGYLSGNIDNVRIYDRAHDTSEIQKLYAMDAPRHGVAFMGTFAVPLHVSTNMVQ